MANPVRVVLLVALATATWGISAFWVSGRRGPDTEEAPLLGALYAAPVERVESHVLAPGETLDRVLAHASIAGGQLAGLLTAFQEFKSPRRLRAGTEIKVRRWVSDGAPRAVELRLNADSVVRLEPSERGWAGHVLITPTTVDTVYVHGEIGAGRSVYQSIMDNAALDLPPAEREALVVDLAQQIYGFKLDFTHDIRPGDRYRLVYEREARPDGTSRSRRVLIAEIVNDGQVYPAIYFDPDGGHAGYYDREGRSLQTMFSKYPVDFIRVTSSFSPRRYHPVLKRYRAHSGTDFGAATGTPVKATGDGTVAFAGRNGGYGNLIRIRHALGYETRYAHLSRILVRPGQRVTQGQVIGRVGATGLVTASHLHYELRKNGTPLNARRVQLPGKPGVPKGLKEEFNSVLERRLALLDAYASPGPHLAGAVEETERTPSGGT